MKMRLWVRLVGSIFKGKVRNLEDGLKAAFVGLYFSYIRGKPSDAFSSLSKGLQVLFPVRSCFFKQAFQISMSGVEVL